WPGPMESIRLTCEPKLCVLVVRGGGGGKLPRNRLCVTLLMIMPLAYSACHWRGLMYWLFVGGRFGFGKNRLRAGRRGDMVAGAEAEGDQLAPPSVLISVKTSKKLLM